MEWWFIPIGIGVVVLLWYLWVAAFHPDETPLSDVPEVDGHVPRTDEGDDTGATPDRPAGAAESDVPEDDGGTWIELDITPLFPSSERRPIVDLTEAEDPEPRA